MSWRLPPPSSRTEYAARELAVAQVNQMLTGGLMVNPLNIARMRLQLQQHLRPGTYKGIFDVLTDVMRSDGVAALWRYGILMSCLREITYGGMQLGLYGPIKGFLGEEKGAESLARKIASGLLAGALASVFVTPVDVVMIRQFVETGRVDPATGLYDTGLCVGQPHRSALARYRSIYANEGFEGMFRGWRPNTLRAALLTAGLTTGYDQTKELARDHGFEEGVGLHLTASVFSAVTGAVTCAPADLIKSRMMAAPERYPAMWRTLALTVQTEGPLGLFAGMTANMARLCPLIVASMPLMEQMRFAAGLNYYGR